MDWIRRKFSRKIGFIFTFLLGAAFFLFSHLALRALQKNLIEDLQTHLALTARSLAEALGTDAFKSHDPEFFNRVRAIGEKTGMRLTLIGPDGKVQADSSVAPAELSALEGHASRPEVMEAKRSGLGFNIRQSHTTGVELLYAALPFPSRENSAGIVRLAMPLTRLHERVRDARDALFVSGGVAMAMSLLIIWLVSLKMSRPLEVMARTAREISEGKTGLRVKVESSDEAGRLADDFNFMVQRLDSALTQLRSEKSEIGAILSSMVEQVMAVDDAGRILFVNPAAEKLFGIHGSSATGKPFVEAVRQPSLDQILRTVLEKKSERSGELRLFLDEEKFFEVRALPLQSEKGNRGALLVLHDVTRIQKLELVRKDFIANVSHELRTPLTSIQGFSETLLDGGLDDKKNSREFVETIYRESQRLSLLVSGLLDLSSIESGRAKPKYQTVSLQDLMEEVLLPLTPLAKKKAVRLELDFPSDFPDVPCDPNQIKQVFTNLIDNAIKFNKEKGSVKVAASANGNSVQISVSDTGSGIPQKDLPRIFERFYRVDKARSRDLGGTGLGLAIVRHIVESHGGQIQAESVEGEGSRFTVTMPQSPEPHA